MNTDREATIEVLSLGLRRMAFQTVLAAGSGHLGGSSSSAELMAALYFGGVLRFDPSDPTHPGRDRVLVRGHLGPLRYSLFSLIGWVGDTELSSYRSFGSRLQGHESMHALPGVDLTPSGSLGMLLSYGVGAAVALRDQGIDATTWVFLGDGEEQEGNVSEAARHAAVLGLGNLVAIIDQNGKQLSKPTREVDGAANLEALWRAYGWAVRTVANGHSVPDVLRTLAMPREAERPTAIIVRTEKGHGLAGHEGQPAGYHTLSSCPRDVVTQAIEALGKELLARGVEPGALRRLAASLLLSVPRPPHVAQRRERLTFRTPALGPIRSYDDALEKYLRGLIASFSAAPRSRLYLLTADWITRAHADAAGLFDPHVRFIDVGIREQHMLACAHGIAATDPGAHVLLIMGDAFILRASDQLHAIAQAGSRVVILGTDAGICEARNGSTHQSTGQPGALLAMPGLEFLEPADAADLHACLDWAVCEASGPVFVRLHSAEVDPLACSVRSLAAYVAFEPASEPKIALVGSGLTIQGLMELAQRFDAVGVGARVINVVGPKRLDAAFTAFLIHEAPALVIYNGNADVLASAVSVPLLGHRGPRPSLIVRHGFQFGTTGSLADLERHFGFDAQGLAQVIVTAGLHVPAVLGLPTLEGGP